MTRSGLAAAGFAATLVASLAATPASAQDTRKLTFQSAFPPTGLIAENGQWFADRVQELSGGRLEIEILPSGALVPPFEVLDAVHQGVIDGGHTAAAYWLGKNRAATLFGPAPGGPFGMDMIDYLGWLNDAGGLDLYREFYQNELQRNVVPIPLSSVANQVLGWFKEPVTGWEDLGGRKCRETGITAEVFSKSGMTPVNMPGGEVIPAAERGVIDCAEWVGPAEDMKVGFQTVWKNYYVPSIHEPATVLELLINRDVWDSLDPDLQGIIQAAATEATLRSQTRTNMLNAEALTQLEEEHGVDVQRTPDDILTKTLESWDAIAEQEAANNPFFKKVFDSQREYASQVVPARRRVEVPYEVGANYYWPEEKQ